MLRDGVGQDHGNPCEQKNTFYERRFNMSIDRDISMRQSCCVSENPESELHIGMSEL